MNKETGGVLFLSGVIIGAAAGLLLAPKKGSELRQDIKVKADQVVDRISEIDLNEMKEKTIEKYNDLRERIINLDVETMKTNSKEALEGLKTRAEELLETAKTKGNHKTVELAEGVKERINRKLDSYIANHSDTEDSLATNKL